MGKERRSESIRRTNDSNRRSTVRRMSDYKANSSRVDMAALKKAVNMLNTLTSIDVIAMTSMFSGFTPIHMMASKTDIEVIALSEHTAAVNVVGLLNGIIGFDYEDHHYRIGIVYQDSTNIVEEFVVDKVALNAVSKEDTDALTSNG